MFATHFGWAAAALAVLAAWTGARAAWGVPFVWLGLLLAVLALPVGSRRLGSRCWWIAGTGLAGVNLIVAQDREWWVRLVLVLAAAGIMFVFARLAAPDDDQIFVAALGLAATAVVAVWQRAAGFEALQTAIGTLDVPWRLAGLTRIEGLRVFGTAALPGHFAVLALLPVPVLAAAAHNARGLRRFAAVAGLVLALAGAVLSRSLAAIVVAALVFPLALARRHRRIAVGVGGALVLAVIAAALARPDVARMEPVHLRLVNWETALDAFVRFPWLGVGIGGVGQAGLSGPNGAVNITPFAHNSWLQVLAETGLAGLPFVAVLTLGLVRLVVRGFSLSPVLAVAVVLVPLHNLVDFSFYAPEVVIPWAFFAGALAARCRAGDPERRDHRETHPAGRGEQTGDQVLLDPPKMQPGDLGTRPGLGWSPPAGSPAGRCETRPVNAGFTRVGVGGSVPGWILVPVLVAGVMAASLGWQAENMTATVRFLPAAEAVERAADVMALAPWAATAVESAVTQVLSAPAEGPGDPAALRLVSLADRVRPRSASLAEAHALLLLRAGRRAQARVWAREARRRAPWRTDLIQLESRCDSP